MSRRQRVLIVGPAWIGDMVMAQTLFKLLKQRRPESQLDVVAPAWTKPLLERMPELHQSIDLPFGHGELRLKDRYRFAQSLREQNYEQVIVLPNSFKSALIPFWTKISRRTGWVGEYRYPLLNDIRQLDKTQLPLMIQQFMALGLEKNEKLPADPALPALTISPDSVENTLKQLNILPKDGPILALCPGAEFGSSKRWPLEYYAEIAKNKLAQGWQVWLFGSAKDRLITDQIEALTDHRVLNLAGNTKLTQAIDLLSLANLVVTNDSGLMHIAAALSRPVVVFYGSTSAGFTPPLSQQVKILKLTLPCSPCFKRECPLSHMKCMRDLHPEQAIAAMNDLVTVN
jgi:heptosyltransferase-2